jgi:hypothetical protein
LDEVHSLELELRRVTAPVVIVEPVPHQEILVGGGLDPVSVDLHGSLFLEKKPRTLILGFYDCVLALFDWGDQNVSDPLVANSQDPGDISPIVSEAVQESDLSCGGVEFTELGLDVLLDNRSLLFGVGHVFISSFYVDEIISSTKII